MATSDKFEGRDAEPFEPYEITGMVYDREKQEQVAGRGEPIRGYFIHVNDKSRSSRGGAESPGVELRERNLECQIVKSPSGKPLLLPEAVGPMHRFDLTLKGKPGRATIVPSPSSQHPDARKEVGEIFLALWEAYE